MFEDHHILKLLFAFFPALVYSFIIYFNDRNNISPRTALLYIIGGYISIGLMRILLQTFPHLQDLMFTVENGMLDLNGFEMQHDATSFSWAFLAFVQVAFFEEVTKFLAWGSMMLFRNPGSGPRDSLFSTMFYCCMISVGFAAIENLSYFITYPGSDIIILRSFTSVIMHMSCGIIMGYFIAMSRLKKDVLKSLGTKLLGLISAIILHGAYDFAVMDPQWHRIPWIGIPTFYPVMLTGLALATLCGRSLLRRSTRYALAQRIRIPSPPEA